MIISEALINEIKNELGVIKARKAEEAYRNKRVQITNIDLTWNYKVVNISAIVVDKMTQKNKVQVRVDLEEGTVLYGYTCNCNLYSYKKCEHILAVILEFNYNPKYEQIIKASIENEKKERDRYMFNNIIGEFAEDDFLFAKSDSLEEKQELPALSTNIELVPVVKENRYGEYELSFKIGNKKMYKIKSLQQFYWSYTNKEVYRYGENLAFKHIEENFANSSKAGNVFWIFLIESLLKITAKPLCNKSCVIFTGGIIIIFVRGFMFFIAEVRFCRPFCVVSLFSG